MDERPTRKRKNVDYGDMMDSGDENDEKPFEEPIDKEDDEDDNDEDLVFVEEKGARANRDSLQEASEDPEKSREFLADMKARHEKDPEGVAAQFKALIDDESTRPAIEAIIKHGMCECAGAHANLCAWILMMWIAATRFRMEHRDAAPERLASMDDEAKTAYLVDACVEIKVYDVFGFTDLHTGEKHEADPEFRWRRPGAVRSGRFRHVAHDGGRVVAAGA